VQKHVGGPRGLRKLELATDAARQSWLKAGKPTEGKAYDEYERAWTKLAQARQARIRASELGLTQELAEQARRRIRAELDRLRSRRVEWAIIFDRRGRVLWRGTSGLAGQVRFRVMTCRAVIHRRTGEARSWRITIRSNSALENGQALAMKISAPRC